MVQKHKMSPEEKINQERRYVLDKIREHSLRAKLGAPVEYPVYHGVIGGSGPTNENEVKTLEKLEEFEAIKILARNETPDQTELFLLELLEPRFSELYDSHNKSKTAQEKLVPKKERIGIRNAGKNNTFVGNTFVGFDVGIDDVGEGTIAKSNDFFTPLTNFPKSSPTKKVELVISVILLIVALVSIPWWPYWYHALLGQVTEIQTPLTLAETSVSTTTLNIADILSKYNDIDTALQQRSFLAKYKDTSVVGSGTFQNIDKPSESFLVSILISGNNLISCFFDSTPENEQKLSLFKKGSVIKFTGTFATSVVWGGGWSV